MHLIILENLQKLSFFCFFRTICAYFSLYNFTYFLVGRGRKHIFALGRKVTDIISMFRISWC